MPRFQVEAAVTGVKPDDEDYVEIALGEIYAFPEVDTLTHSRLHVDGDFGWFTAKVEITVPRNAVNTLEGIEAHMRGWGWLLLSINITPLAEVYADA